jgi:hypothetical protein
MTLTDPIEAGRRFNFPPEPGQIKIPANEVESALQWMVQQPNVPRPILNATIATIWLLQVNEFRKSEDELLASGKYDEAEALQEHRVVLSDLIANGEKVLLSVKKSGMAETPAGITKADLEATLESLHETQRFEHGPKNSPKTDSLVSQLLGV